ncbi:MAG: CoA transferase [Chloroflexi bacterium]|nr:CoA transferase [Chloroflexota bacterium]
MAGEGCQSFPLSHVRVIDLTNVIAGPVATRVLGQLGAQVIKVEQPWGRAIGRVAMHGQQPGHARPYNAIASFNEVNRAKRSVAINLAHENGKGLFYKLVAVSDVLVENYSPRVMGNLGITYAALRKVRPDLVMVSMPAMGASGPWANHICFGPGTDALGGLSDVTGYQGGPPHKPGNFYADHNSAFHVATAVMAALRQRHRTGQGQHIQVVLREATMAVIGEFFLGYQLTGHPPQRMGSHHPAMVPHNVYRCKGDDAWAVIAVASEEEWQCFCKAIGSPPWCCEERFGTFLERWRHQEELDRLIQGWTEQRTPHEVMEVLQGHGVKAGAVLKAPEILENPHWRERGFVDRTEHPEAGSYKHPGLPWKSSRSPANLGQRAPLYAEHREWVLGELLGVGDEEAVQLRAAATTPAEPVEP